MNFSILTAGNIADKMAATVSKMPEVSCYAIAARSLERADAMRQKYGFEKAYGSYEELFTDECAEIIYIASPHSHHYEHAKAALLHKKHVLCEKPAAVNAKQLGELYSLARENGVVFCDATWTRFMPFVKALQSVISSGEIGEAQMLECSMGFCSSHVPRMASAETAGGALLDLGIYTITMALIAFGSEKAEITGFCTKNAQGVDSQNLILMKFADGKLASLKSSMTATLDNKTVIYGTNGRIEINNEFWKCEEFKIYSKESVKEQNFPHDISGYEYEVRSLVNAIKSNELECPQLPAEESLRVLRLMDDVRKSWGIKFPCEE